MSKRNKILAGLFFLLIAVFAASSGWRADIGAQNVASAATAPSVGVDAFSNNPIVGIVKRCSPAVVNIDTETMVSRRPHPLANDPFFREFFGREFDNFKRMVPMRGKGSGFIVDGSEGYILTNNHVVEGSDKITATLMDGRTLDATLIGRDPTFDLAVIQIKADNLPSLTLGDSDAAEVGEWVVAIGNPHGFENSVTAGIISAKNRTLQAADVNFQGFMQTDAAINPGNSGGPLINLRGEVVGINTAIVPYAQGIGFAVPVNMAKQIMSDLIENGEVKRGWLGVVLQDITPGFAEAYKVPTEKGAVVSEVVEDSPAERAGLKRGDAIVAIDGKEMKSSQDVVLHIRNKLAEDEVSIEIYRDSKKQTIKAELGNMPGDIATRTDSRGGGGRKDSKESTRVGATVGAITQELRNNYGLTSDRGVVVLDVEPGSVADEMGLKEGDQVLEVNRRAIGSVSDWERALRGDAKTVVMLVLREGRTLYFSYKK
ncbi:MAG: Do family serine endopeptidase [Synergistaceae bacterium]|jgi:serine protease Do|nr:Do family serine endopeptidase [Synergistaceae bacterium]